MELLFVLVIAAAFGVVARYALPRRQTYGLMVLPALAAAVAGLVWVGLLWLGLTFDGGWIWVASLGAGAVAAVVAALVLPRRRATADARLFAQLSGGRA